MNNLSKLNHKEKFELCLREAEELQEDEFYPETDNLSDDTIASILFKVLHEWDMVNEGEIEMTSQFHLERVKRFFRKWRYYIEDDYVDEYEMYKDF